MMISVFAEVVMFMVVCGSGSFKVSLCVCVFPLTMCCTPLCNIHQTALLPFKGNIFAHTSSLSLTLACGKAL